MLLHDDLIARRERLEKACEYTKKQLKNRPEGHVRVCKRGKTAFYYLREDPSDKKGKYIPRGNEKIVRALATKDYLEKIERMAGKELAILDRYIRILEDGSAEDVFSKMCVARQNLVKPVLVSDEVCARMWEEEPFQQSTYKPEMKIYPTKKGDMVRSKSEVLFADLYMDMRIPYRYEELIALSDGQFEAPDFSLWDKKRRRVIYHEHFGLMDDPVYRKRSLKKIDDYRRSGIYSGKNFIMTFEGDGAILNMKEMRTMIEDIMR